MAVQQRFVCQCSVITAATGVKYFSANAEKPIAISGNEVTMALPSAVNRIRSGIEADMIVFD